MKRLLSMILAILLCVLNTSVVAQDQEPLYRVVNKDYSHDKFIDVNKDDWYEQYVRYVYERGIMVGVKPDLFSPHTTVKREQVAQILYMIGYGEMDNPYATSDFTDVPWNRWYTPAVIWAHMHKVTSGISADKFGIGKNVTREQFAVFLMNYANQAGVSVDGSVDLTSFKDSAKISPWAKKGISFCVSNGIISGKSSDILDPKASVTRAEAAVMLKSFIELIDNNSVCGLILNGTDISEYGKARDHGLYPSGFYVIPITAVIKALGGFVVWENEDVAEAVLGDTSYRIDLNECSVSWYDTGVELFFFPPPGSRQHILAEPYELYVEDDVLIQFLAHMGYDVSVAVKEKTVVLSLNKKA